MEDIHKNLPILKILNFKVQNMRNRFLLLGLFFALISNFAFGQTADGKIAGKVTDKATKEGIFGAQVLLIKDGIRKGGAVTGIDGSYAIGPVDPGLYMVKVQYIGYQAQQQEMDIKPEKTAHLDFQLALPDTGTVKQVVITHYNSTTLDHDNTTTGGNFDRTVINKAPTRSINAIAATTAGTTTDGSGNIIIKGARSSSTVYYVDGVRVGSSAPNLDKNALEELDVITGGVPAEYGDVTGGVISATTRGPSKEFHGSVEGITSQFLDPYGYNLIEGNVTGPLLMKNKHTDSAAPVLGFFLATQVQYSKVWSPPAIDMYSANSATISSLDQNPLRPSPLGLGFVNNANFVTYDGMTKSRVEQNTKGVTASFTGKIDYQINPNMDLTIGGTGDYTNRRGFIYEFNMFNYQNNPQVLSDNVRGYVRFRQKFNSDPKSLITNVSYTVQGSYTRFDQRIQDPDLKDNYFAYGYLGTFNRSYTPTYRRESVTVNGKQVNAWVYEGPTESGVTFTPGDVNTTAANYTTQFFNYANQYNVPIPNLFTIQAAGALINGQSPATINSLWDAQGTRYGSYQKVLQEQYNLYASGQATVAGKHSIKFGVQYRQDIDRSYTVGNSAFETSIQGLWTLARQLMNSHLTELDRSNPLPVYSDGHFADTINFNYINNTAKQSTFDKNFRQHLESIGARDASGRLINDQSIVNIDAYKPSDLKLSYFSADELLNSGKSYVSYYGYDYLGNKTAGKVTLADFLDPNKRLLPAYQPIYTAGYIQDKFEINNFIFRLGLRVDRFDANQPVLKDPFSLYPIRTAGEVTNIDGIPVTHPGNIGSNYAVYVDNSFNPTKIVGYRDGNKWYDATGAQLQDPTILAQASTSGGIQPYISSQFKSANDLTLTPQAFTMYTPQVNVMPRISFSFPISEQANFYANYDVLTQRPTSGQIGGLDYYYYLSARATNIVPNPNLLPESRTNYEVGFKQSLTPTSGLTFQAYYGQIRNLVQVVRMTDAYPINYTSYQNIDFGTVKGLTLGYELRRKSTAGFYMSANYTLQFANGTGSSSTTASNIVAAGLPNLQTPLPLDYDVRHQINGIFDFRLGHGADYIGPVSGSGNRILEDVGVSFILSAKSGTPYTRQSNVTVGEGVEIGVANRSSLEGTINGSRLPWQFRADGRLDKDFYFKSHKKGADGEIKPSRLSLNVYLWVQNILDAKSIISVYRYTGLANDDGYLASAQGKIEAARAFSQQAFLDQYTIKENDPSNYIAPRLVRLGAVLTF
jgi:outer membrane receptor protein involved in Fe transport